MRRLGEEAGGELKSRDGKCWEMSGGDGATAGASALAQGGDARYGRTVVSPLDGEGGGVLVLEDETGRGRVVVPQRLTEMRLVAVAGRLGQQVQRQQGEQGQYVRMLAQALRALPTGAKQVE